MFNWPEAQGVLVTPALLKQVGFPDILESASHYVVDDADSGLRKKTCCIYIMVSLLPGERFF